MDLPLGIASVTSSSKALYPLGSCSVRGVEDTDFDYYGYIRLQREGCTLHAQSTEQDELKRDVGYERK